MMRSTVYRVLCGRSSVSRWTVPPRAMMVSTSIGGTTTSSEASFSSFRRTTPPIDGSTTVPGGLSRRSFASFSMAQLKELRAISGAPVVDCKKALGETSGNVEAAMDWLRQHGAAKAAQKVSGREAEEGLVACMVSSDGKSAAIVKVSSETDFAGKSQAFVDFVQHVATATLGSEETGSIASDDVLALQSSSKTVKTALEEAIVAIRENLGVASAIKLTTTDGMLVSYVHGKVSDGASAGSSAAVVELVGGAAVSPQILSEAGRKLAMHIVASKPTYLNVDDIPEEVIAKERVILQSQLGDTKKPPEVMEKIISGRLRKFYEEVCLTEQEHMVEEGGPKVGKALEALGVKIRRFEAVYI